MASRCSMCLLRTFSNHTRKSLTSSVPRFHFSSQFSSLNPPQNFAFGLCRRFSRTRIINSSQKNEGSNILSKLKTSGAIADVPSSNSTEGDKSQSSEKKKKDDDFRKRAMKYTFVAFGTIFTSMAGFIVYEWGSPHVDEDGNVVNDEFTHMPAWKAYILRTYREMVFYNKMIRDPSRPLLLPEPLTEPYYQPPYTLVLEMTGVLVHPDWTYQTGWRFKKRPGVDYFLQQVGPPLFEVVIYTSEQGFTAYPILDTLDPNGYIMYRLFRDATRYHHGHHVKDLSCLNRDLSKVIFIDWNPKSISLQPDNALLIKKWAGNDEDRTLYDLASLLRTIATSEVEDVRAVLDYYSKFDDPIAVYKEKQRELQEEEQKRLRESAGKSSTLVGTWSSNLRGLR